MGYTQRFEDIGGEDVATAGGKGANLGELTRAGFPVPPGFVILTDAYEAFLEANGLVGTVVELAKQAGSAGGQDQAGTDGSAPAGAGTEAGLAAFEAAERDIRMLFRGGKMPREISAEIQAALRGLAGDAGSTSAGPTGTLETGTLETGALETGARATDSGATFAVRSSATAEDLADASFAGQQETFLNVRADSLEAAVKDCWASLWTARAMAYRDRRRIDPGEVSIAVVVEKMVESVVSGVMFTANPATGRRDEVVVSGAWGLGESVVSGSVGTDDYVVDKVSGTLRSRRIADKAVMTAYTTGPGVTVQPALTVQPGGTSEQPVPPSKRRAATLNDAQARRLAELGARIEEHFGTPQDIEWAMADGKVHIVQSRPITALPEPAAEMPTDWTPPYPKGLYFRASIVEQLPDPLSPLFADLIDGSVTRSLSKLMAEAFGGDALREGDIALPTVNGYAYYYYRNSGFGRLIAKTPKAMTGLARGTNHLGIEGWRQYSHPRYAELVKAWSAKPVRELSGRELLDGVSELLDAGTVYYTAVQSIIPLAATSEIVFGWFYALAVRRAGDPPAATFLLGYDSEPIRAEKSLYDLAQWTREQPQLAKAISSAPVDALAGWLTRDGGLPGGLPGGELPDGGLPGVEPAQWQEWSARFRQHLDRYGHAVYNLDFLNPVPSDDPSPLLGTLKFYLRGQGNDPYERQKEAAARREKQTRLMLGRLGPARRAGFSKLLKWAQDAAPVREDALADIGLAWPLLRRMLLELGRRLQAAGVIGKPDDVFWLHSDELTAAAVTAAASAGSAAPQDIREQPGQVPAQLAGAVEQRKMLWRGQRQANPPQLLPEITWLNRAFAGMMPGNAREQTGDTITGVGASAGTITAPASVLGGPADFGRMQPGNVLVARMTTPAWTSLFAMSSAVVTDIGGPLSHSSIVAREYGIPAVLGTGVATSRIQSGQVVRVDGDAGTVTLNPVTLNPVTSNPVTPRPDSATTAGGRDSTRAAAPSDRWTPAVRIGVGMAAGAAVAAGVAAAFRRLRR